MNHKTRSHNAAQNAILCTICRFVDILINFVARIFFVQFLGREILGINGLFTNVLSFLSLADLGINTAMTYSFYEPLANKDEHKLSALVHFYKRIYFIVFCVVLIVGLILVPFLPYLINMENPIENIELYYILLLLNSSVSYLFVYKSSLLKADQNEYIISLTNTVVKIFKNIVLVILLWIYKNYVLYLIIEICFTIINNLVINYISQKKYKFLSYNDDLDKKSKKDIFTNVKSVIIYKISSVLLNGTDNILISVIVGTIYVGLYSNYLLIINAVVSFINVIFVSLYGSIGNLLHSENSGRAMSVFEHLIYLSYLIGAFVVACLLAGLDDTIRLFFGSDYVLDSLSTIAIILNCYLSCVCQPIWTFRETAGLFKEVRFIILITAIINLVLSIILGMYFGVFGIIIATLISKVSTYFWKEPIILYKKFFSGSCTEYFYSIAKYFIVTLIALIPVFFLQRINLGFSLFTIIFEVGVSGLLSVVIFMLLTRKNNSLHFFMDFVKHVLKIKGGKIHEKN